jgi:hypothetical protein
VPALAWLTRHVERGEAGLASSVVGRSPAAVLEARAAELASGERVRISMSALEPR